MNIESQNNKRIAKNTMFIYFRMALILFVSLYTSRVVLAQLGKTDFGINNVVGGIITMFSFLNTSMSKSVQRFITFALGQKDEEQLAKVFSTAINLHLIIGIIVVILGETIGLWVVNNKLIIPIERIYAANWIYQVSIISFFLSIIQVPYDAAIVAHEKMNIYAYISILDVGLKLLVVYLLQISLFDKLIMYSSMLLIINVLIRQVYQFYCRRNFQECHYHFYKDIDLLKKMTAFASWNFVGAIANVLMDQGINILLNNFFGLITNAARGIAYQVKSSIMRFVSGFQIATNPQIIKYYAAGEFSEMKRLLFQASRYTYYLLFICALPIMLGMEVILDLWLTEIPENTALFARLVIGIVLVDSLSGNIIPAIQATGHVKWYQIGVGFTKLLAVPITYCLFRLNFEAYWAMLVSIILNFLCLWVRLICLRYELGIKIIEYIKEVVYYDILVSCCSLIIPLFLKYRLESNFYSFVIVSVLSVIFSIISIMFVGLKRNERYKIMNIIRKKLSI